MRYLTWIAKFGLFVLLLGFALKNTDVVTVRYFLAQEWHAPLSLVLFLFFGAGAALGVAAALPMFYRQRRELASLRRPEVSTPRGDVARPKPDASLL